MFSSLRAKFAACLLAVVLISGCPHAAQPKADGIMRENVHPNGLIVKLSEDFSAKRTADGFIVEPSGGANRNLRVSVEIKVDFYANKNLPADSKLQEKTVGNRKINYKIESSEGGSGGETFDFTGVERVSGGVIEYWQTTQSKGSEPDFARLWQVIENTTLKK